MQHRPLLTKGGCWLGSPGSVRNATHHAHELRGAHRDILRLMLAVFATSDHRTPARQAGSASTAVSSHMSCTKRVPRVPFNRGK